MSSIFWHQQHEMCSCLKRNHLLSCSMWGQEGPRPAQAFSSFLGRGQTTPGLLWLLRLPTPAPRSWEPAGAGSSYWPTSQLKWLHTKRCHCSFPKRMCLFFLGLFFLLNKFPCHLFIFSNCSSFKAPCLCSFCLCIVYFWKLGNQEEGGNLGELTAVEEESLFPSCALSPLPFLLMTSVVRSPLPCSFQGKLELTLFVPSKQLLPTRCCFASCACSFLPAVAAASLPLFWVSHLAQKVGRWSSRVLGAVKHWRRLRGYVP